MCCCKSRSVWCIMGCAQRSVNVVRRLTRQMCRCNACPFNGSPAPREANCFHHGTNPSPFSKAVTGEEIVLQELGTGWSLVWVNLQTPLSNQGQR